MDQFAVRLIDSLGQHQTVVGWLTLAASALLEYVFPPFPGDTVTVFGGVLVTAKGWSPWFVLSSVMAGSAVGSFLAFALGRAWARKRAPGAADAALERLVQRFRRHGAVWLAMNRFFPGVRSLFFVAAGLAGLGAGSVIFWALVSALLWTLALLGAGALLGANLAVLTHLLATYSVAVWILLVAAGLGFGLQAWRRRARSTRQGE